MTQLTDGTLVGVGTSFYSGDAGDELIWIARLDPQGSIIWQRTFGNKTDQNDGYAVAAASDGGFVVSSLVVSPKGSSNESTMVQKFDANNNVQWSHNFSGVAYSIIQTSDGGYALTGAHRLHGSLNSNPMVLRLDADGNVIWQQIYTEFQIYSLLDAGIAQTSDGDFVVAAKSVFMKIDGGGNILWAHQLRNISLFSAAPLSNGNYAVGGNQIVSDYSHAYNAVVGRHGRTIVWDNTEITYPSSVVSTFINTDGLVCAGGYVPVLNDTITFVVTYFPAATIDGLPPSATATSVGTAQATN